MTRRQLPSQILRAIHVGQGLQSSVYEVDWNGTRGAVKDFSQLPRLFRWFVAPFLVKREVKALKHLDGTPGIPRFLGQIDRLAFATQFIDGRPVSGIHKGDMPPEVFPRMAKVVAAMHARGVAHGDLKRRSNLLLTPENEIFIIDFAAAIIARGPFWSAIMRAVAEVDNKSLPRLKRFVSPELLTEEDLWKLDNPTKLERWVKKLLGPLNLARPEEKPQRFRDYLAWIVLGAALNALGYHLALWWMPPLRRSLGLSKPEAIAAVLGLGFLLMWAGIIVAEIVGLLKQPRWVHRLEFVNRATHWGAESTYFCVYGASPGDRLSGLLCSAAAIFWLGWQAGATPSPLHRILLGSVGAIWFCACAFKLKGFYKPLLVLDAQGVRTGTLGFAWAQLAQVEFEHRMSMGHYLCTRWTFRLRGEKCCYRVHVLPSHCCLRFEEERMVAFVARMMGHGILAVASAVPDSL